ncbi:glutathione S-transferase family protein [Paraburkholderia fynbosensis]|uniref:Disulfide-bond oxidoreductase YfcG n=1 Tax=Paraburkholderia fynbosensis TaxID=1200993 RepID=A0A6J5GPL4_9BURK|nr:glutathione S-transferase N-terminal domain-containing protein [Paraburkholderia fynbosensis]CAB3804709.1 Disulfide-bond oxidoreductase YfcG [Paraburkholderia fynbosensis]
MITLYTWTTSNGRKIAIMLEELGLQYQIHPVDLSAGEQFAPAFLEVSPNNKIPAIVDEDAEGGPLTLFESGAILTYLADLSGQYLALTGAQRYRTLSWLNWQVGGLGPMLGQLGFFGVRSPDRLPIAIERFREEANRLFGVMDRQLQKHLYLSGDEYTIADIAAYPWTVTATTLMQEYVLPMLETKPSVRAWLERIGQRPAVQRGMVLPKL